MLKRGFQFAPGYRLQEFLGRGQFGQVWRATAPGGAAAAVKFIDLSDGQGQKEYEGVRRVKQIRHANLMPITAIWLLDGQGKVIEEAPDDAIETIDLSVAEGKGQSAIFPAPNVEPSWLVVSMLLGGKSLQHRLRECVQDGLPGIPPKELISYMDESAKGLDFLNTPQHDLGEGPIAIQHSDVKPANIVLIGSSAVVCDFGLARILTRNQVTATSAAGTPAYMAPEAISGKPSRTSDQYSLAVTYYHLRTANLPVNEGSLWEVLDAHRHGKLQLGLVPQAEQDVLRKATDLNWENRFESNVEMVDALREALRQEGQTTPGFVPRTDKTAALAGGPEAGGGAGATLSDPTATLVSESLPVAGAATVQDQESATDHSTADQSAAGQSLITTRPFESAQQPTDKGFLKKTLPDLEEKPSTPAADQTASESTSWDPRLVVAGGIGAVVILLLAVIAFRSPATSGHTNTTSINSGSEHGETSIGGVGDQLPAPIVEPGAGDPQQPDPQRPDPQRLVQVALAILDSDEKTAAEEFAAAVDLDPGLIILSPERKLSGHSKSIMQMLQTPDASRLLTIAEEPAPFLWRLDADSPRPLQLAGHEVLITCMTLSPSGQRLLTGGYDEVARVWDLKADNVAASALELKGHTGGIKAAAWRDDSTLVTASDDLNIGVWEIGEADNAHPHGTLTRSQLIPVEETLTELATDPSGNWLVARTIGADRIDQKIDVIAFPWQEILNTLTDPGAPTPSRLGATSADRIAFLGASGGSQLLVCDSGGGITTYNAFADKIELKGREQPHGQAIESIRVMHVDDDDVVVTGSADGSVRWRRSGSRFATAERNFCELGVSCVDVSRDGRWVATGTNDGSVWLWDSGAEKDAGAIQFVSGAGSVDSVVIDVASNWLIAGCEDGVIRIWDLRRAKLLALTRPTPARREFDGPVKTLDSGSVTMR